MLWGCCLTGSAAAQSIAPISPAERTPQLGPVVQGGVVEKGARVGGNLRIRLAVAAGTFAGNGAREHVQPRVTGSMIDFYPDRSGGFHLSAGTRLYDVAGATGASRAAGGLLRTPRPGNAPGARAGLKRTPAVTLGYTGVVDDDTSVGVEVGAMTGRAYTTTTDMVRRSRADRGGGDGPVNPMVNLVVGRRF